jgi:hypothetical protein
MIQLYDYFNSSEKPSILLCQPDGTEIYSLGLAYNTKLSWRFNAISEFSFDFPQSIDGGVTTLNVYSFLKNKRLVKVENFGTFVINDAVENLNGAVPIKNVQCKTLEFELTSKRLVAYGGTTKLWDALDPTGTILQDMIDLAPTWSVGTVDGALLTAYRTFDVSDSNIYNFLVEDCEKAFGCVFNFDTTAKTISAVATANATTTTDIYLSFDNLIDNAKLTEKSDEICTALYCYGGGDLTIRGVNPLGTNILYNFGYYATTEWMSQSLIDAVDAWQTLVDDNQAIYANELSSLQGAYTTLIGYQNDLVDLQADYLALEGVQKVRIEQGLNYTDITAQLTAKQAEITSKQAQIVSAEMTIDEITANLVAINELLAFDANFTSAQLIELSSFRYENTYKNENIITTDVMNAVEIQEVTQALYDQAQGVLTKVSQPRYEFEFEMANFTALPEFATFTSQLALGCVVTAEVKEDEYIETVLLEINLSFDNPKDFSFKFSNRLRLDGAKFIYSDLQGKVQKTGASVSFNDLKWADWSSNYKNSVSTFITSALNTTNNNLINNTNQEILIDSVGLRGRTYDPDTGTFDPTQVWLTSNTLAFTRDAWQTAGLAIGSTTINGATVFGIISDKLSVSFVKGKLLCF